MQLTVTTVGKQYSGSSKNSKIESPYDPAIPLLGRSPKELKTGSKRGICTLLFIAALVTIAQRWK